MPPTRPMPVLTSVLAAAGLMLAVVGCSGHITPLNANPQPPSMPPPRQLGSPVIVQVMRSQPVTATGGCPAGWAAAVLPPGGGPHHVSIAVPVNASAPAASPGPLPGPGAGTCYRPVGATVTITTAAVSAVYISRPPPGQNGPDTYGFTVAVPAADVAAVTALINQAYNSGDALGVSVAGQLWQAPQVAGPFPGQQLQISLLSRNQARQLYRLLVPSA